MTTQTESGVWASLSRDRQRRLIAQMGQLASRYWEWTRRPAGETDERDDAGLADAQREGARASSRPAGGGVCAAIDVATVGSTPGIDPVGSILTKVREAT